MCIMEHLGKVNDMKYLETDTTQSQATVLRLRELQNAKPGDPIPGWLSGDQWGVALSQLAGDAALGRQRPRACP